MYAISELMGHMDLLRDSYAPFVDLAPRMAVPADCGSLCTEKYREVPGAALAVRPDGGAERGIDQDDLVSRTHQPRRKDSVFWSPGLENLVGGLPKTKSDSIPCRRS